MDRFCVFLCVYLSSSGPIEARDWVTDAFGMVEEASLDSQRVQWSGVKGRLTSEGPGPSARLVSSIRYLPSTVRTSFLLLSRSHVPAGTRRLQSVVYVLDEFGNMAGDGTPVRINCERTPDGVGETLGGLAEVFLTPPTVSGSYFCGAQVGGSVQSPRAGYTVTADFQSVIPTDATDLEPVYPEEVRELVTAPLYDRFGNLVGSGAEIIASLEHIDGRSSEIVGEVIAGRGRAKLLSRNVYKDAYLTWKFAGNSSEGALIPFASLKLEGELSGFLDERADGVAEIRIGPFATSAGYLLPDSTEVTLHFLSLADAHSVPLLIHEGYAKGFFHSSVQMNELHSAFVVSPLGRHAVSFMKGKSQLRGAE